MMNTFIRGRYAPSPTGTLHLGNLRTALLAWLFARSAGGAFILRIEDLDHPRVRPGAGSRMLADLRWMGLEWDEGPDIGGLLGPYTQSMRQTLYDAAIAHLRARDLVYPCYCTRAELQALSYIASAPQGGDEAPRYPGTCRSLTQRERRQREREGRRPALRFRAPRDVITFDDAVAGSQHDDIAASVGDFVVRRSDGIVAYQLAVVVDDALMGVTQIVRGADLLASTARQLALFDSLGYHRPSFFAHVPLALDATGARMAKRDASAGISDARMRDIGHDRILGALAASVGMWPEGEPATPNQLLAVFDPPSLTRAPTSIHLPDFL